MNKTDTRSAWAKALAPPYKRSTSGRPAGHQRLAARGGLQGGPPVDHWQQAATELLIILPASVPTDVLLHWFWTPTANLKLLLCQPQQHKFGFQPSIIGSIVAGGLLCGEPPHDYQQSASRLLDVHRQPPLPPLYHHAPRGVVV